MKLLRYGPQGQEKPGLLDGEGRVRDLSGHVDDLAGDVLSLTSIDRLRGLDPASLPLVESPGRTGCAVAWTPNFHAIGLNYLKHAQESGMEPPREPVVFTKSTTCLSGPDDPISTPRQSTKLDWEVELGVVIGREALYVSEADALDYVSAYCTINDVSERAFQLEGTGQWVKGKSAPTFGPVGPWLVTADEVGDPQSLRITTHVNGKVMQDSNTSDMIFTIAQIVSHLSQFTRLVPGDLICTGTPEGVGMGMKPPTYLQPGDVVEVEVHGLGRQRQEVLAAS